MNSNEIYKLDTLIKELANTSSSNNKKQILKAALEGENAEFLKKVFFYTYNPYFKYYVSSANCKKHKDLIVDTHGDNLFALLDALRGRLITGNEAIAAVNSMKLYYPGYSHIIDYIIDGDLKCRVAGSLINKVAPGTIPTFDVALAQKYEPKYCDFECETWYASRKLDGVRCIIYIDENGEAKAYSRQGKEFETLGNVLSDAESLGFTNTVFDGELCIVDENGNEDFQSVMKEIRRKNHTIKNPKFIMFDMISANEFNTQSSTRTLSQRIEKMKELEPYLFDSFELLDMQIVESDSDFALWQKMAKDGNWEGFMIRKDCEYEGKRSNNLLKVKTFFDAEYKVIDVEMGQFRMVENGKEVTHEVLSNVFIEHKGFKVRVGSGFSIDQRKKYYDNPNEILGKTITVAYFEETKNQEGGVSLRFPTVKHVYDNGRDC